MNKSLKQLCKMTENEFTDWICTDHTKKEEKVFYNERDEENEDEEEFCPPDEIEQYKIRRDREEV